MIYRAILALNLHQCSYSRTIGTTAVENPSSKIENEMTEADLKRRTKQFALRSMKLVEALPRTLSGKTVGSQLIRSATAVGANYRSACRGRSPRDFVAKLAIVEEEADESAYWLELIVESGLMPKSRVEALLQEADELVRIIAASRRSAQKRV